MKSNCFGNTKKCLKVVENERAILFSYLNKSKIKSKIINQVEKNIQSGIFDIFKYIL